MAVSKFCNAFEALRDGRSGAAPGAGEAAVLLICSVIYCIYSFILYLVRLEERSMQHPEIDYKNRHADTCCASRKGLQPG